MMMRETISLRIWQIQRELPLRWEMSWEDFIADTCHAMFGFEKPRWHYIAPGVRPGHLATIETQQIVDWGIWVDGKGVIKGCETEGIGHHLS